MNWDVIEGNWTFYKGQINAQWGRLTDADMAFIAGDREKLAGCIQEVYGVGLAEADLQIRSFQKYLKKSVKS